jgi:hypothetical protein
MNHQLETMGIFMGSEPRPSRMESKMTRTKFGVLFFLLSLAMVAFVGVGIRYVNQVFDGTVRWTILGILVVYILLKGKTFACFRGGPRWFLLGYLVWCGLTSVWSELPELSVLKGGAYLVTVLICCSAGYWWGEKSESSRALAVLWPVLLMVLVAVVLGEVDPSFRRIEMGDMSLYRGATANSNLLGMLVIMAAPLAIFDVHRLSGDFNLNSLLKWGMLSVLIVMLIATNARASLGGFLILGSVYLLSVGFKKYAFVALSILLIGLIVGVTNSELWDELNNRFLLKGQTVDSGVFASRQAAWEASVNRAEQGGMIGGGFGVSIGDTNFVVGLSAVNYGREKGNSSLAIIEEIGMVGFSLYLALVCSIFYAMAGALRRGVDKDQCLVLSLVLGTLLGLVFQSQFEAWWLAPGNPATPYFWMLTGIGLAISNRVRASARPRPRSVIPKAPDSSPAREAQSRWRHAQALVDTLFRATTERSGGAFPTSPVS